MGLVLVLGLALAPSARADCAPQLTRVSAPAAVDCPPSAAFSHSPPTSPAAPAPSGTTFTFDASASRGTNNGAVAITEYAWDWNDDGVYDDMAATPTASHAFASRGAYPVKLRVTDAGAATATAVVTVYVGSPPTASFTASSTTTSLHAPVGFDASASAAETGGSISSYEWDWTGDGSYDATTAVPNTTHVYSTAGSYSPKLRVTDDIGLTASYTLPSPIVASNQTPVARLSLSASVIPAGGTITLDGSASSDADSGGALAYAWDLDGDGGFEMAAAPAVMAHSFPNPGVYNIHLRVTDVDGGSAVATATLTVTAPPGGGNGTIDGGGALGTDEGPASATGTGIGSAPGSGVGAASSNAFTAGLAGSPIQKLKTVSKRGLVLTCTASRAATCSVAAWIAAKDAKRLGLRVRGKRPVKLAAGSAKVLAQRTAALQLKAGGQLLRALRRARTVRITVQGAASDGSGRSAPLTRAVIVRR